MILEEVLDEIVHQEGADFFGVADLSLAHNTILEQSGVEIASYPRGINIGIALLDSIVNLLPQGFERAVAVSYRHHYDVTNLRLDLLAARVASVLQKKVIKRFPYPRPNVSMMSGSVLFSPIKLLLTWQDWAGLGKAVWL